MRSKRPVVVIVRRDADVFSKLFSEKLSQEGVEVQTVAECALGDLLVVLRSNSLEIGKRKVAGVLFRASPRSTFTMNFTARDRGFCDAEIRAVWLAALHLPFILAVNRFDAEAWFRGANWTVWRQRLIIAGFPVAPFTFGDAQSKGKRLWLPYRSAQTLRKLPNQKTRRLMGSALTSCEKVHTRLLVCGRTLSGEIGSCAVAGFLAKNGVRVAEITSDVDGRIISINTQPEISNVETAKKAAHVLARWFCENLHI